VALMLALTFYYHLAPSWFWLWMLPLWALYIVFVCGVSLLSSESDGMRPRGLVVRIESKSPNTERVSCSYVNPSTRSEIATRRTKGESYWPTKIMSQCWRSGAMKSPAASTTVQP